MRFSKITYYIFFLLAPAFAYAQQYPFENFTTENGLPVNNILSLFQNDDGILWIGTQNGGIVRYDGSSFEMLTDKQGLPDNIIFTINKDAKDNILIGTNNGLSVYSKNKFKNYTAEHGLGHNRVMKIFIDRTKNAWIGTAKGVCLMRDTLFMRFDKDSLLNNSSILNIYQDTNNNYWFCTATNGLFKYDGKSVTNYNTSNGLGHNTVYDIMELSVGKYWVLTHNGVYELSENAIHKVSIGLLGLREAPYFSIVFDTQNNIWLSGREGVVKYDHTTFKLFKEGSGLVNNDIWRILQDREKNFWFASKVNGLSKLSSERFYCYTTQNGLTTNSVTSIFQSRNGKYWVGTANGLAFLDKDTFYTYHDKNGLSDNNILSIAEDKNGLLWIGAGRGLNSYNGKAFTQYYSRENENLNKCYKIYIDKKDEMWLGTKGGIAKVMNGKILYVSDSKIDVDVFDIYQDKQGVYWFATENGLYNLDGSTYKHFGKEEFITEKRIRSIVQDSSGTLWFSSSSGIYRYDKGKFINYTIENGISSNTIYSMTIDNKGYVWAGMSNGIDKIEFEGAKIVRIKHYEQADGFIGQDCYLNSIKTASDGKIWVGTTKGLMIYQPKYDKENTLAPITVIKQINLFSQPTHWNDFADSVSSNNIPFNLLLPYEKNYLSFYFTGVSLTTPSKVRYQYMLKGLDKEWGQLTEKTEAVYSNLAPGEYEFLVKAANEEGLWNTKPVSFKFKIAPPFWRTWWFYSICFIIFASGVFSYLQIRRANTKIRAANKEIIEQKNIIEDKNVELEIANVEIAKKNKDITDSINYAKRIQEAILPPDRLVKEYIYHSFILYKPKDIISGDFYWMGHKDDKLLFAVADCTGHGVPGALMSIVGHNGLNTALREHALTMPGEILDQLNKEVEETFSQQEQRRIKDGMDIALCCIDYNNQLLHFSGAYNPLYIIRKTGSILKNSLSQPIQPIVISNQFALYEIKADRQPIGAFEDRKNFITHSLHLEKDDSLYIFSDGFADQFGGPDEKKFMYSQLKKLFLSVQNQSMESQKSSLHKAFEKWKGDHEQVDDVCIMGIRI